MGPIGSKRYITAVCYDFQLEGGDDESKPHVVLKLRCVEGPDTGRDYYARGYLTEKAHPITMQQMRALGWSGTKLSKAMAEGLGTRKATVRLTVEEYKGKVSEKVTGIYEPKARGPKNPIDEGSLSDFDALFEETAAGIEVVAETALNKAPAELPAQVKGTNGAAAKPNPNALGF